MDIMDKPKEKKIPALAMVLGKAAPGDETDDEGEVDDEGADGEEEALQQAGDAAIEAMHAGDGLSLMKAMVAGMKASSGSEDEDAGA
jgi:hypothetical protein